MTPVDQIKDYEIGICCFSAKNGALTKKSKDRLAMNRDGVSTQTAVSAL
jgi:hypothetical protein